MKELSKDLPFLLILDQPCEISPKGRAFWVDGRTRAKVLRWDELGVLEESKESPCG